MISYWFSLNNITNTISDYTSCIIYLLISIIWIVYNFVLLNAVLYLSLCACVFLLLCPSLRCFVDYAKQYTAPGTACGVQRQVFSALCTACGVQRVVYRVWCTECVVQSVVYSVWCTECGVQSVLYRVWCTACGVQRVVNSEFCAACGVQHVVYRVRRTARALCTARDTSLHSKQKYA